MHIADFSLGMLGANGIVGGGIPIATGAAVGSQMNQDHKVTVCFFGDGASNQGSFHESLNLASAWKLPIVYVCENNLYAETTPQRDHQAIRNIADRAVAYGMPGEIAGPPTQIVAGVLQATLHATLRCSICNTTAARIRATSAVPLYDGNGPL